MFYDELKFLLNQEALPYLSSLPSGKGSDSTLLLPGCSVSRASAFHLHCCLPPDLLRACWALGPQLCIATYRVPHFPGEETGHTARKQRSQEFRSFPGISDDKESACNAGDLVNPWLGKIFWRRAWLPTPVFLPREFLRQRSLAGYST